MGYYISKLKCLPNIFNWYYFLVGDYRNHGLINNFFNDDFCIIAEKVDKNSAFIAHNNSLQEETRTALLYISNLGKILEELEGDKPGLLILNKHPLDMNRYYSFIQSLPKKLNYFEKNKLIIDSGIPSELNEDDTIIYIPFDVLEKAYTSTNMLLSDIVSFSKGENKELLRKTSKFGKTINDLYKVSIGLNLGIISINFDI